MNRVAFVLVFIVFVLPLIAEFIIRFCLIPVYWICTGDGFDIMEKNFIYKFLQRMGDALGVDFEL